MKIKLFHLGILFFGMLFLSPPVMAMPTTEPTQETEERSFSESLEAYLLERKANRQKRIQKIIAKGKIAIANALDIDLKDPINKWLWFAIIAAAVSVLLTILGFFFKFFGFFRWLAYMASVVCFAIWIVKYLD